MKHRGIKINHDKNGYFAHSHNDTFGYCETIEAIKAEIDNEFGYTAQAWVRAEKPSRTEFDKDVVTIIR